MACAGASPAPLPGTQASSCAGRDAEQPVGSAEADKQEESSSEDKRDGMRMEQTCTTHLLSLSA